MPAASQQPSRLPFQARIVEQLAALGSLQQLFIWRGIPQKERQPLGHLE